MSQAFVQSPRLLAAYTPRKIGCPIVFFRASDNVDRNLRVSLAEITSGAITIEDAHASHYSLLDPQHASTLGAALSRHLTAEGQAR
jgi:hypothetical protein